MNRPPFWLKLEIWWIGLTAAYWAAWYLGYGFVADSCIDSCSSQAVAHGVMAWGSWWSNFLGLFVPLGPNNFPLPGFIVGGLLGYILDAFSLTITSFGAIVAVGTVLFLIMLAIVHGLEVLIRRFARRPVVKIAVNLTVLLTLTLVFDLVMFQNWKSLEILLHQAKGPY